MKVKSAIVFCVEKGLLESQAVLLTQSINEFSNFHLKLFAYSPRKDFQPGNETRSLLNTLGVTVIDVDLNQTYLDYPIANKVLACEHFEKTYPDFKSIIFTDTDTVFLNPLNPHLLNQSNKLFLRPVDNKGPGSEGEGDDNDLFWIKVFDLFQLELPQPEIKTTVRPHTLRPYFNAGFIWSHGLDGFFQQWKKDFEILVKSGLRPFGWQSRDKNDFRCLDQVALAVTSQRFKERLTLLPETFNYPIPFRPFMKDRPQHPELKGLTHVHYHKWFQHPGFLDHVCTDKDIHSKKYRWLKERLPLKPEIDGAFKC